MILALFQALVFTLYVLFITIKFKKILPSISESWYELQSLGGVWYSLFSWFMVLIGFPMVFHTNGQYPSLFFLSAAGLCLVGVATMFKLNKSIEQRLHIAGATIGILSASVGLALERNAWIPLVVGGASVGIMSLIKVKNKIWWLEIISFLIIMFELLLY